MDTNIRTIAQWLLRNERYQQAESQRTPFPEDEEGWENFDTMAGIYINKIEEMPDVNLYDIDAEHHSFRVCLGSAKIHGRRVMRLPEITLVFAATGISSTRVFFTFSDRTDEFQDLRDIFNRLIGAEPRHDLQISCHPHISADGMPCLGDFSQPWAQTYASNDLPMLINVAKSFLNNWTARDAYWNINTVNRKWQDYVKDRGISFKHFMYYHQILDRLGNHLNMRSLMSNWILRRLVTNDVTSEYYGILEQGETKNMDFLDVWASLIIKGFFTVRVQDKKDEKWNDVCQGMAEWSRATSEITSNAHEAIIQYCEYSTNLIGITEDVLYNCDYIQRYGITRRADVPDSMMNLFKDQIMYVIKELHHTVDASLDIRTLHTMLHRVINDESIENSIIWLQDSQVNYALGTYFSREWFNNDTTSKLRCFISLARQMIANYPEAFRTDMNEMISDFIKEATDLRYGESRGMPQNEIFEAVGFGLYRLLTALFDNGEWEQLVIVDRLTPVVARKSIEIIEEHYNNNLERIRNGKAKFNRAYGYNTRKMMEKINYLHHRFSSTEWSGPAWYTVKKKTKKGFPKQVELTYFKPIDLGNHGSTELDGEELGKVLPKVYKQFPELKKSFMGLIHSHHNMGAFFSGTDEDTALEQAPNEGLFFTTVVAHNKDKFATGVSYRDQFGLPNFIEGEVKNKVKIKVDRVWKAEADRIEKEAKTTFVSNHYPKRYGGQGTMWANYYDRNNGVSDKEADKKKSSTSINNSSLTIPEVDEPELLLATQIYDKLLEMEITGEQFAAVMKERCPNVDPYLFSSGYYDI